MDSTIKGFLSARNLNTQRTESDERIEELEAAFSNMSREYDKRADRIEELESERDAALKRATHAEEQWGRCTLALADATENVGKSMQPKPGARTLAGY